MLSLFAAGVAAFLAWVNGANDNFKGVATLFGSNTTSYRSALVWDMVATLAGCVTAVFLSGALVEAFQGIGLVPESVRITPGYGLAVALAAASTVLLATVFGLPISTTHALIGGMVGRALPLRPPGWTGASWVHPLLLPCSSVLWLQVRLPLLCFRCSVMPPPWWARRRSLAFACRNQSRWPFFTLRMSCGAAQIP